MYAERATYLITLCLLCYLFIAAVMSCLDCVHYSFTFILVFSLFFCSRGQC